MLFLNVSYYISLQFEDCSSCEYINVLSRLLQRLSNRLNKNIEKVENIPKCKYRMFSLIPIRQFLRRFFSKITQTCYFY